MSDDAPAAQDFAAIAAATAGLSGLETMRAIAEGRLPQAPLAGLLNFRVVRADPGEVEMQGMPDSRFANPQGTLHGGWYGALLDSALGCAVHTRLAAGVGYTTLEYKVNLIRAIPFGTRVRAVATCSHAGRSTAVAEGRIEGAEDGRLYATGSTTCMLFRG